MRFRIKLISRKAAARLGILLGCLVGLAALGYWWMFWMPGRSFAGVVHAPKSELSAELERHVRALADGIGERGTYKPEAYRKAEAYLVGELEAMGYAPRRLSYDAKGVPSVNIEVEIPGAGRASEIVVVGAHYDTVESTPGANDNSSGVAGVLALARRLRESHPARTIRFVLFANEEPAYFQTSLMGSMVYATGCKSRGERIAGMISLETLGYFTDTPLSQRYPWPLDKLYPTTGNFIGFVGNLSSRPLLQKALASFRKHCEFPSEGGSVPGFVAGVGWSDQWGFWECGYPAIMVTDTARFRYPYYHSRADRPEKVDFAKMAKVVEGMEAVVRDLTKP